MKTTFPIFIAILCLSVNSRAQKTTGQNNVHDLYQVDMTNQKKFISEAKPLIEQMGQKRIVALGEGTHAQPNSINCVTGSPVNWWRKKALRILPLKMT